MAGFGKFIENFLKKVCRIKIYSYLCNPKIKATSCVG